MSTLLLQLLLVLAEGVVVETHKLVGRWLAEAAAEAVRGGCRLFLMRRCGRAAPQRE